MEQYSEDKGGKGKMVSSCVTSQLAGGNSTKDHSHHQQLMEKESPDSPSPVKRRWAFGPLLQSFKSKMASFTEIVMSPVRIFKPADSLSSIVLPDQPEKLVIESNMESSIRTEEGEMTNGECRNELLSKRPSSEKVECNSLPKRHRVTQRLNFDTFSSSYQEPVLEHNEVYDDAQVTSKDNQIGRPSLHPQVILQDKNCHTRPCTAQSPYLRSGLIPSSNKPLNSMHDINASFQDATVVIQRLSSTRSEMGCEHGNESNTVLADRTEKPSLNITEISNTTGYRLKNEDAKRCSSEESFAQATRKSPRKLFKHLSETAGSTSTKLATFGSGPVDGMKNSQSVSVKAHTYHSVEVSDPPNSTSVENVRSKRGRGALRTGTKTDIRASQKCDLWKAEEGGLRCANNKRVKESGITLEENQEDIICAQVRKKRKGFSTSQKFQDSNISLDTSTIADVEMRQSETSESCESTEIQEKRKHFQTRKNQKCRMLQACSNKSECTDSTEDATRHVLTDSNTNIMNDCNCEISKQSQFPDLKDSVQTHEAEKTTIRKTRRHVFKNSDDASLQKRILRPTKHTFKDYSAISVVDPAGPSGPSRKTVLQNESQKCIIATDSTVSLQSDRERRRSRTTKISNRQKRKQAVAKRKNDGGKDKAEIPENVEAIPVLSLSGSGSNRLLRSYSCPEIPSLLFSDCHVPLSHTHDRGPASPTKKSSPVPLPVHLHSPSKRLRRHTVCSVEIEREIAPLCLRKEVYPSSRGSPSHSLCPSSSLCTASSYSPSNSLTAHASCFLSSPLAFLSKNSSLGRGHDSDIINGSARLDATSFSSTFVTSSTPPLCSSSFASTLTFSSPLTDPSTVVTPSPEISSASVSSLCSAFSQSSSDEEHGTLQMECQEAMDEEKAFGLKLSTAVSEEKAFSDSEIKMDSKDGQRGKVSSIRICKKIPKPQNNLTPMGLPKVIRIKKKDFSLEEIYTNKNFSKPPDGRLETIFEVPQNRRDGSQTDVGQKKVKRFVEFPELGVARKPKKPLVVGMAGGGAHRKAGGNSGISRTRRGVGASSKVEDALTLQQLDSLLCSKLEELDTWMELQQVAC